MIIKQNHVGTVCSSACLFLRKEDVSVELHDLLTPTLLVQNLLLDFVINLSRNEMHDLTSKNDDDTKLKIETIRL
jgi:hypothetical protein